MIDNDRLFKHIFTLENLTVHERMALIFIASQRNQETLWCRPTQKTICAHAGKSRFWLQCFIVRMRERQILVDIPFRNKGSKFVTCEYWFMFDLEELRTELSEQPEGVMRKKIEDSLACIHPRIHYLPRRRRTPKMEACSQPLLQAASKAKNP